MKKIIYKCSQPLTCDKSVCIGESDSDKIYLCSNNKNCENIIPIDISSVSYQCLFRYKDNTFERCRGTLKGLKLIISELLEKDKEGMWGKLKPLNSQTNNYIVIGPERTLDKLDKLIDNE